MFNRKSISASLYRILSPWFKLFNTKSWIFFVDSLLRCSSMFCVLCFYGRFFVHLTIYWCSFWMFRLFCVHWTAFMFPWNRIKQVANESKSVGFFFSSTNQFRQTLNSIQFNEIRDSWNGEMNTILFYLLMCGAVRQDAGDFVNALFSANCFIMGNDSHSHLWRFQNGIFRLLNVKL